MNKNAWNQEMEDQFVTLSAKFGEMKSRRDSVQREIRNSIREFLTKDLGMIPGATITLTVEEMFMKNRVDIDAFLETLPEFDSR